MRRSVSELWTPFSPNEAPHPQGTDPRAEPMYVSDRACHGLSFEGLYFSVRSRVRELWTKQVLGGYSVIGARACVGGPPRARTPPHMTSEVMLSAFIRVYPRVGAPRVLRACVTSCLIRTCDVMPYPRACDVIIRVYPRLIVRVWWHTRLLARI